jgi:hypothetical protein
MGRWFIDPGRRIVQIGIATPSGPQLDDRPEMLRSLQNRPQISLSKRYDLSTSAEEQPQQRSEGQDRNPEQGELARRGIDPFDRFHGFS